MDIRRMDHDAVPSVMAAAALFDSEPRPDWVSRFLTREGHHLLIAYVDEVPAGFVSGVETIHPDKGTEMLLYELGVAEQFRQQGIGRALTRALLAIAGDRGCYGMWVPLELDNDPAVATYRSAGAAEPAHALTMTWSLE
jgi:ribosomal protein S18 acetylase RimI-like enzyme